MQASAGFDWLTPSVFVSCLFKPGFQAYRVKQHLEVRLTHFSLPRLGLSLSVTSLYIIQSRRPVEQE